MIHGQLSYVDDTLGCDAVKFEFISQRSAACLEDEGSTLNQNKRCHVSGKKKYNQNIPQILESHACHSVVAGY